MINKLTGEIRINEKLIFFPGFSFEDFKKTPFYNNNQDGIRAIYLDDKQMISGKEFYVSFFFKDGIIYAIILIYAEISITEEHEMERKKFHDEILATNDIINGKEYNWGKVISEYDAKSNSSEIVIVYKR